MMAKFRISYIDAIKDLTGGFGSSWIGSKSENYEGYLNNAINKAEAALAEFDDSNSSHFNHTLLIGIFEKRIKKIFGFLAVSSEQLVWRKRRTSKGALPVRAVA